MECSFSSDSNNMGLSQ